MKTIFKFSNILLIVSNILFMISFKFPILGYNLFYASIEISLLFTGIMSTIILYNDSSYWKSINKLETRYKELGEIIQEKRNLVRRYIEKIRKIF